MYTCRFHPDLTMPGPGQCPDCGLDGIPAAETGGFGLTCPMHQDFRQQLPGECPACGAGLVPASSPPP